MKCHYAELELYYAHVQNQGRCSNGMINPEATDEWNKLRFWGALRAIHQNFDFNYGISIEDENFVVRTKDEGEFLCNYAEKNISGANAIIQPVRSQHGIILFYKKIIFSGWIKKDKKKLIEALKKSGHVAIDEFKEGLLEDLLVVSNKKDRAIIKKKLNNLDEDRIWKEHLKFY